MCTRYRPPDPKKIKEQFGFEFGGNAPRNPNLAPTEYAPIYRTSSDSKPHFEMARFGLLPAWAVGKKGPPLLNAKRETVKEKAAFKNAYQKNRCIIPAEGFYEWREENGKKMPYYFSRKNGKLILFAGLWAFAVVEGQEVFSFAIVTGDPNSFMAEYHDRMPVITDDVDGWLNLKRDAISDIAEISFEEYQVRPMNPAMNKASEKDLDVIEAWPQ